MFPCVAPSFLSDFRVPRFRGGTLFRRARARPALAIGPTPHGCSVFLFLFPFLRYDFSGIYDADSYTA